MNQPSTTCSEERIRQLLLDQLPEQQAAEAAEHIAICDACRERLEQLAGESSWWSEVSSGLLARAEQIGSWPPPPATSVAGGPVGDDEEIADFAVDFLEPSSQPGTLGRLGDCEIVDVIGRGGMGIVLKGFQRELGRYVAVKVMAPHLAASGAARKRFAREAQAAAAIVHPNVMPILTVSSSGKLPFLVMPYLAGESLQQRLEREGPLQALDVLRIGVQVARGLAAAHAQGLIHRDIKPANILLERSVDRVMLTDFGLARAVDDASLTRTGVISGTPQFMSPEQTLGDPLSCQTDLFSLGSVLYAMCTGRPPFRAETSYAVLRRIVESQPRGIAEINPAIPEWLVRIVERLHAKDPAERYPSAEHLAQLLEQCVAHLQQPALTPLPETCCLAIPPATGDKFGAQNKRPYRIAWVIAVACVAIFAFSAAIGMLVMRNRPGTSGPTQQADGGVEDVVAPKREGEPATARSLIAALGRKFPPAGDEFRLVQYPANLNDAPGPMMGLAKSPDGLLVASGSGHGSGHGEVVVWDVRSGRELWVHRHRLGVRGVAFSPDSARLAIAGQDGSLQIADARTGELVKAFNRQAAGLYSVVFTPNGQQIITAGDDPVLRIWNVATGALDGELVGHEQMVISLDISPNGSLLVSGGNDRTARVWDLERRAVQHVLSGHGDAVNAVRFSADGKRIASASFDGKVRLFNSGTGQELLALDAHCGRALAVAFSPDGTELASGYYNCSIVLWNLATKQPVTTLRRAHDMSVFGLHYLDNGLSLISSGFDGVAKVWQSSGQLKQVWQRQPAPSAAEVPAVTGAWSPDEQHIATIHAGGLVRITRVDTGEVKAEWSRQGDNPQSVLFCDEQTLALGCQSGALFIWKFLAGAEAVEALDRQAAAIRALALSASGDAIATVNADGQFNVWRWSKRQRTGQWEHHADAPTVVVFAPGDDLLASGHVSGQVRLWDVRSNTASKLSLAPPAEQALVTALVFSSDGSTLAACDRHGVRLWEMSQIHSTREAAPRAVLNEFEDSHPVTVAFTPRSAGLVIGLASGSLQVWNYERGTRIAQYLKHATTITSLAIAPQSETVLSLSNECDPQLWTRAEPTIRPLAAIQATDQGVRRLHVDWLQRIMYVETNNNRLLVWSLVTGNLLNRLGDEDRVTASTYSSSNEFVAVSYASGRLQVSRAEDGELIPLISLEGAESGRDLLTISPDGRFLAAARRTDGIQVYDLHADVREPVKRIGAPPLPVTHITFSPDSQYLLVCTGDYQLLERAGAATAWNCATWTPRDFGRHTSEVRHGEYDSENLLFASSGADRTTRVWDAQTGVQRARLPHNSSVFRSLFVPNSDLLCTATYEGHVWLWNTLQQEQVMRFPAHAHFISGLSLSPDRSVLATASQDGYVKFWASEDEEDKWRIVDGSRL